MTLPVDAVRANRTAASRALGLSLWIVLAPALTAIAAAETRVVPREFLRRWDPITVFFDSQRGPDGGGPEDQPNKHVQLTPSHPGAYTWVDARTLMFRPTTPWPALQRFVIDAGGARHTVSTLLDAPTSTLPADGETGLEPVFAITLGFAESVDETTLAAMTRIELRPLPGLASGSDSQWLESADFAVKAVPSQAGSSYVLALRRPIPLGIRAVVHLRLALDDLTGDDVQKPTLSTYSFSTSEPFRVAAVGCASGQYPIAPGGSRYAAEQALRCSPDPATVQLNLTNPVAAIDPVIGRNLVRFEPAVADLNFTSSDRTLTITGGFLTGVLYKVRLDSAALVDIHGQSLRHDGPSELFVFFEARADYVRLRYGSGICERRGPKRIPVEGRGDVTVDLRIHKVDPLDQSLWPFPTEAVEVDESERPPGPGEEPAIETPSYPPSAELLSRRIALLGSPLISTLVKLPLERNGRAASFGLDLAPVLDPVVGANTAGTYLVGLRRLDGTSRRWWMRLTITDLAVTTLEEANRTRFVVTSLATGAAVAGATVRLEGLRWRDPNPDWVVFANGTTGPDGSFVWTAPGPGDANRTRVRRLVVEYTNDRLVLDTQTPPERFHDGHWFEDSDTWLGWTLEPLSDRSPQSERIVHLFTERPMYRPEDPVHISGFVRERLRGQLKPVTTAATLVAYGPDEREWRMPVEVGPTGRFYHLFDDADQPSGRYTVSLEIDDDRATVGDVSFTKEAYRIPRFEVRLHSPETVPLDRSFELQLTASYYAGGRVGGQPLRWRVTQFPYVWAPKPRDGFIYSTDSRFAGEQPFEASPRLERTETTDDEGSARLQLDPTIEPTAQPRAYIIEATVTGADDQTVSAARRVVAVPPFVLGLKAPRFLEQATALSPQVLVAGPDGELLPGVEVTVRLKQRQWHSHLRPSDFSDGVARYVTDVVDEPVAARKIVSTSEPVTVEFPLQKSGVYIVELEAHDGLGRAQVVWSDLYAGGDQPIAWPRPHSHVFATRADRATYRPGDAAQLVLESPFQRARVLAVVEAPEGNLYSWLTVRDGAATFTTTILGTWTPRVPIHFVLMRGRVAGSTPDTTTDQGKPATFATTTWLDVEPVDNRIDVKLDAPARALPGSTIQVAIQLRDPAGNPRPGEVTLWLVDRAVLSLGRERPLDPVPDFITAAVSRLSIHDTRNLPFGLLPLALMPGGDEGLLDESSLLDRVTIRRNFQPVPFYAPAIAVDSSGNATVDIVLPDDVTVFAVRAKATSGPDRFGSAAGEIAVRLPVVVQPALPRFARPGDQFVAGAVARIVEGESGPARAQIELSGARLADAETAGKLAPTFAWDRDRPHRLDFTVDVDTVRPANADAGEVRFKVAVERLGDHAADAFQVTLPVLDDRREQTVRTLVDLVPGKPFQLAPLAEPARPGSVHRSLLFSREPAMLKMAAALEYLGNYPHGCTEQRLSATRALIATGRMFGMLSQADGVGQEVIRAVQETSALVDRAVDDRGLVAYWPGATGCVSLTSWALQMLVEARTAGVEVDTALTDRLSKTLDRALRSDYRHFVSGQEFAERAWALTALASAGELDPSYVAELSRKAEYLNTEGVAHIALALAGHDRDAAVSNAAVSKRLVERLWSGIIVRSHQGQEVYGGLQPSQTSPQLLPSDTRTLAAVTRAIHALDPKSARFPLLIDGLIAAGRDDGWGSTNANAEAITALVELLGDRLDEASASAVRVQATSGERKLAVGGATALAQLALDDADGVAITLDGDAPVTLLAVTRYMPSPPASVVEARNDGFVVSRAALRVVAEGAPLVRQNIVAGSPLQLTVGDVLEEHVQVVSPQDRTFVAVIVPLAAGVEPLNPRLETAPPEAKPRNQLTFEPTYADFRNDKVTYYFDTLAAGTYDFYFRTRAVTAGRFIQPPAEVELMYDEAVRGNGAGTTVLIQATPPAPPTP